MTAADQGRPGSDGDRGPAGPTGSAAHTEGNPGKRGPGPEPDPGHGPGPGPEQPPTPLVRPYVAGPTDGADRSGAMEGPDTPPAGTDGTRPDGPPPGTSRPGGPANDAEQTTVLGRIDPAAADPGPSGGEPATRTLPLVPQAPTTIGRPDGAWPNGPTEVDTEAGQDTARGGRGSHRQPRNRGLMVFGSAAAVAAVAVLGTTLASPTGNEVDDLTGLNLPTGFASPAPSDSPTASATPSPSASASSSAAPSAPPTVAATATETADASASPSPNTPDGTPSAGDSDGGEQTSAPPDAAPSDDRGSGSGGGGNDNGGSDDASSSPPGNSRPGDPQGGSGGDEEDTSGGDDAGQDGGDSGGDGEEEPTDGGTLAPGDEGEEVEDLQRDLNTMGYRWVRVNGRYDEATTSAVYRFQDDHDVVGDPPGVYGPNTRETMDRALGRG
ncbi:peptidoglycan-binding domain-containing protein [Allostreptomyces psammosilenae]|uniref:Cell division septation protein DedD n=1 Tax=Allostreptomyces psammosilenae TaxID=1892865 RepID=A0A853A8B8_9ACTN|nr:peptidoglycan-binding domain-containing protein [Allostreptomyces psammosilenae]NYI06778.1 cell division septation protein DedD [Allostreptomyces psammosilenae]